MTASIIINEKHATDFNSVAWCRFGAWTESLPPPKFKLLVHLWEHGWAEPIEKLHLQLTAAVKSHPPKNKSAAAIAKDLTRLLSKPKFCDDPKGVVIVTDGEND